MSATPDYLLLRRDLGAPLPERRLPAGIWLAPIEPADARGVHALLQDAYAGGMGSVHDDWLDWWESVVGDSEFDRDLCFIARADDGEFAGFCLCWNSSFVKDLAVAPAWRGRGLGRALLVTAMSRLQAHGADEVSLKVKTANAPARRLYASVGFAE